MIEIIRESLLEEMLGARPRALADEIAGVDVITSVSERLKEAGEPYETKITVVRFTDGTEEKAVCDRRDAFSIETGVTVCIAKHLAGGQGALYDAVRRGKAMYEKRQRRSGRGAR